MRAAVKEVGGTLLEVQVGMKKDWKDEEHPFRSAKFCFLMDSLNLHMPLKQILAKNWIFPIVAGNYCIALPGRRLGQCLSECYNPEYYIVAGIKRS